MAEITPLLHDFLQNCCLGKDDGISFIDSTPLSVCHVRRSSSNKVFKGSAAKGKTSVGWFFGLKLHLVINSMGEIVSFCLTPGNTQDADLGVIKKLTKWLKGLLIGDRGYLSKKLFKLLLAQGLKLITKIRKNMVNKLVIMNEKILLKKRPIVECAIGKMKEIYHLEHTRHRSPKNFLVHLFGSLCAYCFDPKKPGVKIYPELNMIKG